MTSNRTSALAALQNDAKNDPQGIRLSELLVNLESAGHQSADIQWAFRSAIEEGSIEMTKDMRIVYHERHLAAA